MDLEKENDKGQGDERALGCVLYIFHCKFKLPQLLHGFTSPNIMKPP